MSNPLGAYQAQTIRTTARDLAALDNIAHSSSTREILHDLGQALADLVAPVQTLLDDEDDGDRVAETVAALTTAAAGLQHLAHNQ